jgi:NitT/TauT family transport system substrate-binding protein
MSLSTLLAVPLAALALFGAAGIGRAAEPLEIRVGWFAAPPALTPFLFAKPGLARHQGESYVFTPVRLDGAASAVEALRSGAVEVTTLAFTALGPAIGEAGLDDLEILADVAEDGVAGHYSSEFMVLKDGPITTVAQLKGKVLASDGPGGVLDLAMRAMLHANGLEAERDYTTLAAPAADMPALLQSGKADLVALVPRFAHTLRTRTTARTLFTEMEAMGTAQTLLLAARGAWVAQHRPALNDFFEDALRATRWFLDPSNRGEAVGIVADFTGEPPAAFADWIFTRRDYFRHPGLRPNLQALQRNLQVQKALGFLKAEVDLTRHADLGFVEEAGKRVQ